MKKKVVGLVLSLTMVAGLVMGCGGSSASSTAASSTAKTSTATSTAASTAASMTPASTAASTAASKASSTSTASKSDKKYKIGFSQCTLGSPFYTEMKDVAESYAKELGVDITVVSADDDVQKQNNDINDLISSGIDALILNPMNTDGVATGIQACKDAGIPVITVDRMASSGATAAIVRDNKKMGNIVGEALLKTLGGKDNAKGTILELQGTSGDQVMMDRRDGFEEAFKDASGIKIVQSAYCDYERAKAITAAQDLIQANTDIVAVYGHNDDMALGGMQACQEAGLKDVKICGVDGLMEAINAIAAGNYSCTALNDPGSELKIAIDTCIKVLDGETVDASIDAGTGLVDSSNASQYVNADLAFAANDK